MSKKKGFTLIELMVVVAIIAILTAIVLASLSTARAKSRDAKRISDVKQLQLAVENYFSNYSKFPSSIYTDQNFLTIFPAVPTDPSGQQYPYLTNSSQNEYCIGTNLEVPNPSITSSSNCLISNDPTLYAPQLGSSNQYIVTGP